MENLELEMSKIKVVNKHFSMSKYIDLKPNTFHCAFFQAVN